MWVDDYHDNYFRPENQEELDEMLEPLMLLKKGNDRWERMHSSLLKCVEMFGYLNVSIMHTDTMKYGDRLDEFLAGFWVNLKEAEYNDGNIEFENADITIENGFMFIRH